MKTDSDDTFVKQINKALPTSPQTSKGTYLKFSKAKKKRLGDSIFTNSFVLAVGKKNNCLILKLFKVQKGARQ